MLEFTDSRSLLAIQDNCFHEWIEEQNRAGCVCAKCRYRITKLEMVGGAVLPVKGHIHYDRNRYT